MMKLRVGVTGVGGGVGQSIINALQMSSLNVDIIAIDMTADSTGFYIDGIAGSKVLSNLKGLTYPPDDWYYYAAKREVDCIIPGSDYDLAALSYARDEFGALGCKVLVSDHDLIFKCADKHITAQELRSHNIAAPETLPMGMPYAGYKFPVIVKPRIGSGSRGVVRIDTKEDLLREYKDGMMVQEYLFGKEFTCSVFVDRFGDIIGTFQLERELKNGTTCTGEVCFDFSMHRLLCIIGKVFKPRGPLNVQLRYTKSGPIPFELNCRCSGTTEVRATFGYNEPEMMIRDLVLGENLQTPRINKGKARLMRKYVYEIGG